LSSDTTYSGPYAKAAQIYRQAGWPAPLPLGSRPGVKYPPPQGWTGHGAPYPSRADIAAWAETHGDRNIGVRMPPGVIGLDVDHYKDKTGADTLAELEQRFGPLPSTWVSSARPAPSGIRFYRVPEQIDGSPVNWPGEAGKFIEIIQPGHRYAVVWPSTNPEAAGAEYEWRLHDEVLYAHDRGLPGPDQLPPLPEAWVRGLALPYERVDKATLGSEQYAVWWSELRPGGPRCEVVHTVWTKAVDSLRNQAASRHEAARDAVRALVALGGEGHCGVPAAVEDISRVFATAVGPERIANGEWHRLLAGAVELAAAKTPDPLQHCEHDSATVIEAPPGFSMPAATSSLSAAGVAPTLDGIVAEVCDLLHDEALVKLSDYTSRHASTLTRAERERWRAAFKDLGLPYAHFDRIVKAAAAEVQAARAEKARASLEQKGGRELSPPANPMAVARELLKDLPTTDGIPHLGHWRGDFYTYTGTHWQVVDEPDVRSWIYRETEHAWFAAGTPEEPTTERWLPNPRKVSAVADALGIGVLHRPSGQEHEPAIALTNGVYDLAAERLLPHSPARWNLNSLPFAYEPDATCPQWEQFLIQVLPQDSVRFLQEWIGYLISGRTNQQKIASLVGLPRTGKGTTARIVRALLGSHNVAAPMLGSLIQPFGLEPLLGKSLALFADVKWTSRGVSDATELIKTISGEDGVTVHRKHKGSWEGDLPTRFMFMSNDTPSFTDASGALALRMIHIRFTRSFAGHEDIGLTDRLLAELPGIFLWALEGLRRLDERGHFHVPAASVAVDEDVRRTASPHLVFLQERCVLDPSARTTLDAVWMSWESWCRDDGSEVGNKRWFTRKLKSVAPTIDVIRDQSTVPAQRIVTGLQLVHSPFPLGTPLTFPAAFPSSFVPH
jgi:putative DNA primase/helicase